MQWVEISNKKYLFWDFTNALCSTFRRLGIRFDVLLQQLSSNNCSLLDTRQRFMLWRDILWGSFCLLNVEDVFEQQRSGVDEQVMTVSIHNLAQFTAVWSSKCSSTETWKILWNYRITNTATTVIIIIRSLVKHYKCCCSVFNEIFKT